MDFSNTATADGHKVVVEVRMLLLKFFKRKVADDCGEFLHAENDKSVLFTNRNVLYVLQLATLSQSLST